NPASDFTDGVVHNVGTLRASSGSRLGETLAGIRTPTLLGVHDGAPYLHDGSAATLADVFTTTGGRLIQAENAELLGGAFADTVNWYPMKEWHQGAFVDLEGARSIRFSAISTAAAGPGYLEARYNVRYGSTTLRVVVNGGSPINVPLAMPNPANSPSYL